MKTRSLLLVLAVIAILAVPGRGQALNQSEVNKLAEQYLREDTDSFARDEIVLKLYGGNRLLLQKPLKTALGDEAKRGRALELAVAARVPGLFDTAKKFADSDHEEHVARLALATSDKGAAAWAFDRWKQSPVTSASWGFVDAAFRAYSAPADVIRNFKDYCNAKDADSNKLEAAVRILAYQLGAEMPEKPADLLAQWDKLKAAYDADAKPLAITGNDLLVWPSMGLTNATRVGANYRMGPGSRVSFEIPADWNKQSFTLAAQVRLTSGSGLKFSLMTEKLGMYIKLDGGEWKCPSFKDGKAHDYTVKARTNEWTRIAIKLTADAAKGSRNVRAYAGTSDFIGADIPLDGTFTYFLMDSGETTFLLGGVEFIAGTK